MQTAKVFPPANVNLVIFDLAGTTVADEDSHGSPLVVRAWRNALSHVIHVPMDLVPEAVILAQRGKEKAEAARCLIRELGAEESQVPQVLREFLNEIDRHVEKMHEVPGATATLRALKDKGVRIAMGSGFPKAIVEKIVKQMEWNSLVDYVGYPERIGGRSRPDPAMIINAMSSLGITDPNLVVKVGDTPVDMQEGMRARVFTVGVLTGGQERKYLENAGADVVIPSVNELLSALKL